MKDKLSIEKTFRDFQETLRADAEDQYTGFLLEFVGRVLSATMALGKEGFAPVMSFTVYVKQVGQGGFKMILRPSRSSNPEAYEALKLGEFGQGIMDAFKRYAIETCGMTPVIDERDDLRKQGTGMGVVEQWSYTNKK